MDHPHPGVRRIRLNRSARKNALDAPTVKLLYDSLAAADEAVVVLGSTDPQIFCSGADTTLSDEHRAAVSDNLYALYELMVTMPVPIIAAWDGPAVGGGAQLALAADVRIVGAAARLRLVGLGHGLVLGSWALPAFVGRGRAVDWTLSMRWVEATEAWQAGLVSRPVEDPAVTALELAALICELDRRSVARFKRTINDDSMLAALRTERRENATTWSGSMSLLANQDQTDG